MIDLDRTNAVSQAFLQWARRHHPTWPPNTAFLGDPDSMVDGQQVEETELQAVIGVLEHRGLVDGPKSLDDLVPNPALLTDEGVICVADFDGDVQRWTARNRGNYINQPVTVTGQGNQVAAFSSNVRQTQHTEISNVQTLREVAQEALAGLDEYEVDAEDAETVRSAARRVLDETADGDPEPSRVSRLARSLWSALLLFGNTALGTEFSDRLINLLMPLVNVGGGA